MQASGPRLSAPSLAFLQQPRRSRADVLASFLPRHAEPSFVMARDAEGRVSEITRRAVEADFRAVRTAAITPELYSPPAASQRHDALLSEGSAGRPDRDTDASPFGDVVASHSQTSLAGLEPSIFMMEVDFPPLPDALPSDAPERQVVAPPHDPQPSTVGDSAPSGPASQAAVTAEGSVVMVREIEDVTPVPSPSAPDADRQEPQESHGDVPAAAADELPSAADISTVAAADDSTSAADRFVAVVPEYIPGITATHRPYPRLPYDISEGEVVAAVLNHPGRNEREVFHRLICDFSARNPSVRYTEQQAENLSAVVHTALLSQHGFLTVLARRIANWGQLRTHTILQEEDAALSLAAAGGRSVDPGRDRVRIRPSRAYHECLGDYQKEAEANYDYEGRLPDVPPPRSFVRDSQAVRQPTPAQSPGTSESDVSEEL